MELGHTVIQRFLCGLLNLTHTAGSKLYPPQLCLRLNLEHFILLN